jgi:hypothetical protein
MKLNLTLLFLLTVSFNLFSQSIDSILVGAYLNSSPNPNFTWYNFSIVKPLGFNTIIQRAIVPINGIQTSNFDSLKQFSNTVAGNDSVFGKVVHQDNIDWVYYFTNALYTKWSTLGNIIPDLSNETGLKYLFGSINGNAVTTGTDTTNIGKLFINGPNYSQYQKYVYTNKYNVNNPVKYKVNFRIKKGQLIGTGNNVCRLQVVMITPSGSTYLADSLISIEKLDNEYKDLQLSYNYGNSQNKSLGRGDRMLPPTTIPPKDDVKDSYYDEDTKIQFRVVWLGNFEISLEYIEVFDEEIWEGFFINEIAERNSKLITYLSKFANLHPNLKYFITLDEPHSLDSYHPIKSVQHILDSLNSPVKLLTHFYPGWNNQRESYNTLGSWYNYVLPNRLMYWYFPYWVGDSSDEGLFYYGNTLMEAAELDKNFFATVQTWGYKKNDGSYIGYRSPTPAEVSAQTLYALSFGAKGILYEPFYSYQSWIGTPDSGESALVEGIVDLSFNPRPIYSKIKNINERVRGNLGSHLARMNYNGFLRISNNTYGTNTPSNSLLQLIPGDQSLGYNFHAGMFTDTLNLEFKYFLLLNLNINSDRSVNTLIKKQDNYSNFNYQSVDPPGLIDTMLVDSDTLSISLPAGDGALLSIKPALLWGGRLRVSDTMKVSGLLLNNLEVKGGQKLVILSGVEYTIKDSIEFKDSSKMICNGYILRDSGGIIIQNNWNNALFRSKSGQHPLLFWSKNTTMSGLSNYRVYRKNGNSPWLLAGSTENCEYLDTAVTLAVSGQQSGSEEYYKIVPVNRRGFEGSSTNEIMYEITGDLIEKKGHGQATVFEFRLDQNYPNPFNPSTMINFELPSEGRIVAELYDIRGEKVKEVINREMSIGNHSIILDGSSISSGVYFLKLKFGKFSAIKKIILLK